MFENLRDDDDDHDHDEQKLDLIQRAKNAGALVPLALLQNALGARAGIFETAPALCVSIHLPSSDWVAPIVSVAQMMGRWSRVIEPTGTTRNKDTAHSESITRLAAGGRVLCVSTPQLPLSPVAAAADIEVKIDKIGIADVSRAILNATGSRPRGLKSEDIAGVGLIQAMAAIRADTTAASCLKRLRAAGTPAAVDPLVQAAPLLSELRGYGEVGAWGERLVKDLDLWRRGELPMSAIQRNAVLAGPPGVGKTAFVRSLAKTAKIPLFASSMGTLFATTSGYLDSVIKGIDALFANASRVAPALIFLDELEGIPSRSTLDTRHASWWTPVVNHFLTVLDGSTSSAAANLIVIGATNHPDRLDPALVRQGRLDQVLWISPPDETELVHIYRQHLGAELADADLSGVAALSLGHTGADVVGWIKSAKAIARSQTRPMMLADLVEAVCPTSSMSQEDNYRVAVHEAGHAVAADVLNTMQVKSIALTGGSIGGRVIYEKDSKPILSLQDNLDFVVQLLAGRAAEEMVFGTVSGGAGGSNESDLARASALVASCHLSWGLGASLMFMAEPQDALAVALRNPSLIRALDAQLAELYSKTLELVHAHRSSILAVAELLVRDRAISGDQFDHLMRARPIPVEERDA
ncbi:AAA family ATPase [Devosia sediminis]|uniref:AAA family ATPase n=1 Tax=Devosia sediminis TaxID=2798801 RepID=A0A934J099_9HYPH|nr:AAA family ATPase [Devosia sediminis]MBJ3786400.1 AAA family ATPase [Devosia sediminis]